MESHNLPVLDDDDDDDDGIGEDIVDQIVACPSRPSFAQNRP